MSMLERVTIVGAGLMSHGIAQVLAAQGHPVRLFDANDTMWREAFAR